MSPGTRTRRALMWVAVHATALAIALMFLAPLLFITLTALMSDRQALSDDLWPDGWHFANFVEVFSGDMVRWTINSTMYATLSTVFMLVSSVPVAYALARFRFRGRNAALVVVISAMMLPPQVTMVPLYIVWARFDLTGTLWPLIIPQLFGDAFSIFLLRQFLVTIPREYADAARVDGCGEFRTMLRVILPMAKPALAAVALFQFFYCWNDYFRPLVYADPDHWTLAIGVATFRAAHEVEWNLTMAATLLTILPVLIVFFLAQRVFIQGVTLTGVKG
ncbi:carbohydrate ABC transporter membrane protein 2 (CUT1 family) [Actinomadura pelletieri DSM 43383]|uniref:Carbohydrate ABC transporter membrane protein 2 (CUT1 family) n=1 Tax=Actinomadura pelletieri DSM 43383 TaxID=1120940 RepID=A0A495QLY0_9ACTN|nr:carbohydrate ABC transporter permease [Actinomadura pelletieri]RKS73431.1 carbohydrate ABC transporter membrane protein 2 (CUT1 family) [Actinomadura pelletieri DSM 43383]